MKCRFGAKPDQGLLDLYDFLMPAHEATDRLWSPGKSQIGATRADLVGDNHGKMAGAALATGPAPDPARKVVQAG
jgi:hypothetical protein